MDKDIAFEIDLEDYNEMASQRPEAPVSGTADTFPVVSTIERLERLLSPFSVESTHKARVLLKQGKVSLVKEEGQAKWFNVAGSTLYVTKVTTGEDFQFAECSCPNGVHRGGEAACYHSIAARVSAAGEDFVTEFIGPSED